MSLDTLEPATRTDEVVIPLWPEGPPGGYADIGPEVDFQAPVANGAATATIVRNVSHPTLTVYRPDAARANGHGVIVCPGGGWRILAWDHEGIDLARWLAARGYTAFLLKYRVRGTPSDLKEFAEAEAAGVKTLSRYATGPLPRSLRDIIRDPTIPPAMEMAADDGRRALALVRERAGEWGVKPDKIGMVGFSAGAFLTVDVALQPGGAPLLFAAPIYGGDVAGKPIPKDAPPLFAVIAADDRLLLRSVQKLYQDWSEADLSAEFHVYAKGGHGFGMTPQGLPSDKWVDAFGDWLVERGFA